MKPTVYLAGKMAGLTKEEMKAWRKEATEYLKSKNFNILDPTEAELSSKFHFMLKDREIVQSNKYQIDHSDIVLAELNYNNISIGTIGELVYATMKGKPVICWGKAENVIYHPWVKEHSTIVFGNLDLALEYLVDNYKKAM